MRTENPAATSNGTFAIFNDRHFKQESPFSGPASTTPASSFPLWSTLPQELRLKIWTWHLRQRRFLRVLLEEKESTCQISSILPDPEGDAPVGSRVDAESSDSDPDEWSVAFSGQLQDAREGEVAGRLQTTFLDDPTSSMSALQTVCRESYEAYKSFYRIRLPAFRRVSSKPDDNSGSEIVRIVAHLHPDFDTFSLQAPHSPHIIELNLLPIFLHIMNQYDFSPANIRFGIRNLCVDLVQLSSNYGFDSDKSGDKDNPTSLPPEISTSVRLTISHLRNLYIRLVTRHLEPRVTSGPLAGSGARPWYNASMPIIPDPSWGFTGTVEAIEGVDPRLTQCQGHADLDQVWIGNRLRPSLDVWAEQELAWGVRAGENVAGGVRVRALVGVDAESVTDSDLYHESLMEAMQEEQTIWSSLMDPTTDAGMLHRELFDAAQQRFFPQKEDDSSGTVTPEEWFLLRRSSTAVGFWLVEPEALEAAETTGYEGKKVANLREMGKDAIELWVLKK